MAALCTDENELEIEESIQMEGQREEPKLIKRDGFWYFTKRIPPEFASLDSRKKIERNTGVRIVEDPKGVAAAEVVKHMLSELIAEWNELIQKRGATPRIRLEEATAVASQLGFTYIHAEVLAKGDLEPLLQRLRMLKKEKNELLFCALLGGVEVPE